MWKNMLKIAKQNVSLSRSCKRLFFKYKNKNWKYLIPNHRLEGTVLPFSNTFSFLLKTYLFSDKPFKNNLPAYLLSLTFQLQIFAEKMIKYNEIEITHLCREKCWK